MTWADSPRLADGAGRIVPVNDPHGPVPRQGIVRAIDSDRHGGRDVHLARYSLAPVLVIPSSVLVPVVPQPGVPVFPYQVDRIPVRRCIIIPPDQLLRTAKGIERIDMVFYA